MQNKLSDDKAIFLQIKEGIEIDILGGILRAHQQIPSANQIAMFYGVNPITVKNSFRLLSDEGTIYKKRGLGMYVSPEAVEILSKKYREGLSKEYGKPLVERAKLLKISKEELFGIVENIWYEMDQIWEEREQNAPY